MANNLLDYRLLVSYNWLLNNLLLNNLLLDRLLVYDLPFNWVVFNSFLVPINGHVFDHLIVGHLGNVLSLVFNCVIISHVFLPGNLNSLSNFLVFHHASFIRNILDSAFTFNWRLLSNDGLSDHLLSNWLLDILWLDDGLGNYSFLLYNCLLIISGVLL